jgi:hypothetical protein
MTMAAAVSSQLVSIPKTRKGAALFLFMSSFNHEEDKVPPREWKNSQYVHNIKENGQGRIRTIQAQLAPARQKDGSSAIA